MSCYHRYGRGYWHGCDGPPPPEWYEGYGYLPRRYRDEVVVLRDDEDDRDELERPRRRRGSRRGRRYRDEESNTSPVTAASLQERAASLREELARIEEDLATLTEEAGPHPVD